MWRGPHEWWAITPTDAAEDALIDFRNECAIRQQGDLGEMWARTYEIAVRVAGVVAFGCYEGGLNPSLTEERAKWAVNMVREMTLRMCKLLDEELADSDTERDTKKMLLFIRAAAAKPRKGKWREYNKAGCVPLSQITKHFWRINAWKRGQILETLVTADDVECVQAKTQTPTSSTSPPTKLYRPVL